MPQGNSVEDEGFLCDLREVISAAERALKDLCLEDNSPPSCRAAVTKAQLALREAQTRLKGNGRQRYNDDSKSPEASDIVHLNVGGRHISTSRGTLCSVPDSMLSVMFSGRHTLSRDSDGRYLIDRNPDMFSHVLDFLRGGARTETLRLPSDAIARERVLAEFDYFCISPTGDQSGAQPLTFWALRSGSRLSVLRLVGHTGEVNAVHVLGSNDVISASDDGTLRVWDTRRRSHTILRGHEGRVMCLATTQDSVISGGQDGRVCVWDTSANILVRTFNGSAHQGMVRDVHAANTAVAVTTVYPAAVNVMDLRTGEPMLTLPLRSCGVLLDGGAALLCANGRTVEMWATTSGKLIRQFRGNSSAVVALRMVGSMVVSRNTHSTFMVWDYATGALKGQLICDTPVGDAAFKGFEVWDQDHVVFADDDHVEVWSLSRQARVTRLWATADPSGASSKASLLRSTIHGVAVAPWGVAGACADNYVRIWRLRANAGEMMPR